MDPGWKPRATGFFNNDRIADIVWHHQTQDSITIWLMGDAGAAKGTTRTASVMPSTSTVDADRWRIAGSGDFNGDGNSDILWQDQLDGWLAVWLMDGKNRLTNGAISFGSRVDTAWKIAAVGDYNRDGRPDIVWHNPSTGQLAVWLMDGTTIRSVVLPTPDSLFSLLMVGPK